ncbi:DNA polymerase zeta catalytic subunit [Prunus yedoensis var. nudiflora]|uniref:DNA polymerase zeta catalytic subunit n=1 Tax=Prunus yedoensis var. nudiflora TaxID=2094558 RepID=A0A314Z728_PRUYE|nr:DNA polymerase zeta catalytic subunit [Prunus yedoensis var. nudiflora]PQQ17749.1 DNA polymerase zeta catalytic subunit [Prunus yedoensis var. nudiflora]
MLARCSVRDLMRRKRSYRIEPPECGSQGIKEVLLGTEENEETILCAKRLDFQMSCADATTFEITFEGFSSKGGVCEMPFENPVDANAITVTTFLNNEGSGGQKLGLDSVLSGLRNSPFGVIPSDDKGLIEMSFCRKPLVQTGSMGNLKMIHLYMTVLRAFD